MPETLSGDAIFHLLVNAEAKSEIRISKSETSSERNISQTGKIPNTESQGNLFGILRFLTIWICFEFRIWNSTCRILIYHGDGLDFDHHFRPCQRFDADQCAGGIATF